MINIFTLTELAKTGTDIEITPDSGLTSLAVNELIKIVVSKNSHIIVHARKYHDLAVKEMVRLGGNHITIRV